MGDRACDTAAGADHRPHHTSVVHQPAVDNNAGTISAIEQRYPRTDSVIPASSSIRDYPTPGGWRTSRDQTRRFSGRLASSEVAQTHSTGTITRLESGTTIKVRYRELFVLRRSSEGWQITDYMFNSPMAAEA